jgi:hypothetical protein
MEKQKSFLLYLTWESQFSILESDEERWNVIENCIRFHKGEPLEFKSTLVKLMWENIKFTFEANSKKWEGRAERSRQNGQMHQGKTTPSPSSSGQPLYKMLS